MPHWKPAVNKAQIDAIGQDQVLDVINDVMAQENVNNSSYIDSIVTNADSSSVVGNLRDNGHTADAYMLSEASVNSIKNSMASGGTDYLAGFNSISTTFDPALDADADFLNMTKGVYDLGKLPTSKAVISDSLTSSLLGARPAQLGPALRRGDIGALSSMSLASSKSTLNITETLAYAMIPLIKQIPGATTAAKLALTTLNALTGFQAAYNGTTDVISIIPGASGIEPSSLSTGYGTNMVAGSVSGLSQSLQSYQGTVVTNSSSLATGTTRSKLQTAMGSMDRIAALRNAPNISLLEGEKTVAGVAYLGTTRNVNNLGNVINNMTTNGYSVEDMAPVVSFQTAEQTKADMYASNVVTLEESIALYQEAGIT